MNLDEQKTCPNCNKTKAVRDFGTRKDKDGKEFAQSWCRECRAPPGK